MGHLLLIGIGINKLVKKFRSKSKDKTQVENISEAKVPPGVSVVNLANRIQKW